MSEFREKLVNPKIFEENLKNYLEKMKEVKEIIIWGAAVPDPKYRTPHIHELLNKMNLSYKIIGYADNDSKKWGGYLMA